MSSYAYQLYTKTGAHRYLNESGNLTSKLTNARRFSSAARYLALCDGSFTATMPGKFINFPTWEEMPSTIAQLRTLCPGFFKQRMKRDDKQYWVVNVGEESFLLVHRVSKSSQGYDMHIWPCYKWLHAEEDLRFQAHFEDEGEAKEWRKSGMTPKDFQASKAVPV